MKDKLLNKKSILNISKKLMLFIGCLSLTFCNSPKNRTAGETENSGDPPNVVFILADDMGYGDINVYNPGSRIPTPNLDKLAAEGMRFVDAHTNSAVCTPTRYGLLTGEYCWRTSLKKGVLWPPDDPPLIKPGKRTIANMLKEFDYQTAAIGKWHLGMEWGKNQTGEVDFNQPIRYGVNETGFDHFFGIAGSLNMIPFAFYENHEPVSPVTETQPRVPFPRNLDGGPKAVDFEPDEVLDRITREAVEFIQKQTAEKPFFLYFPLTSPHLPMFPGERFKGRTGIGLYGDFVMHTDWSVGQVLRALEEKGMKENTLVFFTSDNGSFMYRLKQDQPDHTEVETQMGYHTDVHRANLNWRGTKADIYEGGHRVPFIVRWPGKIKQNSQCRETICITDVIATIADIVGYSFEENEARDSYSILPLLLEKDQHYDRPPVVHHSVHGMFALRDGKWKMIFGNGSGGRQQPLGEPFAKPYMLFNMENDPAETTNVIEQYPEIAEKLKKKLEEIRNE